jgi:hypothetical protein
MAAIRIYKEGSNVVIKDDTTGLVLYSVPPENWRLETKTLGNVYLIRFYNELTKVYGFSGASFTISEIKDANGNSYVTPVNPSSPTIAEVNLLHTKLNLFINSEGYINVSQNYHFLSTASNNEILISAAPTIATGWNLGNTTAQYRYVKLHNIATTPVQGTTPVLATIAIPPNSSVTYFSDIGLYLSSGLAITASNAPANNATGDAGLNDIVGEIFYLN